MPKFGSAAMFDFIFGFLEAVWPRLGVCLLFGIGTAFIPLMFDRPWWVRLLLGLLIFGAWLTLGIVLEIAHALKKRRKDKEKEANREPKS
jgi:uncharacterized membrane protein YbhN (UPF0104 family)